jgi:hypothetical protein
LGFASAVTEVQSATGRLRPSVARGSDARGAVADCQGAQEPDGLRGTRGEATYVG